MDPELKSMAAGAWEDINNLPFFADYLEEKAAEHWSLAHYIRAYCASKPLPLENEKVYIKVNERSIHWHGTGRRYGVARVVHTRWKLYYNMLAADIVNNSLRIVRGNNQSFLLANLVSRKIFHFPKFAITNTVARHSAYMKGAEEISFFEISDLLVLPLILLLVKNLDFRREQNAKN